MWQAIRRFWRRRDFSRITVVIYTRSNCPLCDEAKHFVEQEQKRLGFSLRFVDIDADAALKARYDQCVPVIEVDGRERFRGRINSVLWSRLWH
jgi:glutaredoxin